MADNSHSTNPSDDKPGFTPGPWRVIDHNWQDTGIYAGDERVACLFVEVEDEEADGAIEALGAVVTANAHLIASAPSLYEALEEALAYANKNDWPESLREKARKALRLARGESSNGGE